MVVTVGKYKGPSSWGWKGNRSRHQRQKENDRSLLKLGSQESTAPYSHSFKAWAPPQPWLDWLPWCPRQGDTRSPECDWPVSLQRRQARRLGLHNPGAMGAVFLEPSLLGGADLLHEGEKSHIENITDIKTLTTLSNVWEFSPASKPVSAAAGNVLNSRVKMNKNSVSLSTAYTK